MYRWGLDFEFSSLWKKYIIQWRNNMIERIIDWFIVSLFVGFIAVILLVVTMSVSLNSETKVDEPVHVGYYHTVCLDGVLYWESAKRLAVYIDKETLAPKSCEVKMK